jgi:hypothetical protein
MKNKKKWLGMSVLALTLGFVLIGCATWDGATYTAPPQPPFNAENVAKGEFFVINSVYGSTSNSIEGLCFVVNLGTFDSIPGVTAYEMTFPELGTGPVGSQGITLHTSNVQERDISLLPPRENFPLALLRNGQVYLTNETNENFLAGGHYYLYKTDEGNFPMIYSITNSEETIKWGGSEIPKSAIIDGINATVALEYGWKMEETQSIPSTNTLEKRSSSTRDRERSAIVRYIQRASVTKGDTWYVLTNDARPGETFYAHFTKGPFSIVNVYRKIN